MNERLEYERHLAEHPGVPCDPERARGAVARFEALFGDFTPEGIARRLEATYAPDVRFDDTLKTVYGRRELGEYLAESARLVTDCRVEIAQTMTEGADLYVRWAMTLRFVKLAGGRPCRSVGISHLRLDAEGRILMQQDFWDSARGLFDHVPILGRAIRWIRGRL